MEDIDDVINANGHKGGRYSKVQSDYNYYKDYKDNHGKPELYDDNRHNRQPCAAKYLKDKFGVVPVAGDFTKFTFTSKEGANKFLSYIYKISNGLKLDMKNKYIYNDYYDFNIIDAMFKEDPDFKEEYLNYLDKTYRERSGINSLKNSVSSEMKITPKRRKQRELEQNFAYEISDIVRTKIRQNAEVDLRWDTWEGVMKIRLKANNGFGNQDKYKGFQRLIDKLSNKYKVFDGNEFNQEEAEKFIDEFKKSIGYKPVDESTAKDILESASYTLNESDGWDLDTADIEDMSSVIDDTEALIYELKSCRRGVYTDASDWAELGEYIKELAERWENVGNIMIDNNDSLPEED